MGISYVEDKMKQPESVALSTSPTLSNNEQHKNDTDDREEGEIVDDCEYIISSDEELNMRKRIQELEAKNEELEQIERVYESTGYNLYGRNDNAPVDSPAPSIENRKSRKLHIADVARIPTDASSISSVEFPMPKKRKRRKKKSKKNKVYVDSQPTVALSLSPPSEEEESPRERYYNRHHHHYRHRHQHKYNDHYDYDRTRREYTKYQEGKYYTSRDRGVSVEQDLEVISIDSYESYEYNSKTQCAMSSSEGSDHFAAERKYDEHVYVSREKLRLALAHNTTSRRESKKSLQERLHRDTDIDIENRSPSPCNEVSASNVMQSIDNDDVISDTSDSLEEKELRLIALKSAYMRKHQARKKRNAEVAYSPTDFDNLFTGTLSNDDDMDIDEMDIESFPNDTCDITSPIASPRLLLSPQNNASDIDVEDDSRNGSIILTDANSGDTKAVDMDIANSDSDEDDDTTQLQIELIPLPSTNDFTLAKQYPNSATLEYTVPVPFDIPPPYVPNMRFEHPPPPLPPGIINMNLNIYDEAPPPPPNFSCQLLNDDHSKKSPSLSKNAFAEEEAEEKLEQPQTTDTILCDGSNSDNSIQECSLDSTINRHSNDSNNNEEEEEEALRALLLAKFQSPKQSKTTKSTETNVAPLKEQNKCVEDLDTLRSQLLTSISSKKRASLSKPKMQQQQQQPQPTESILKEAVRRLRNKTPTLHSDCSQSNTELSSNRKIQDDDELRQFEDVSKVRANIAEKTICKINVKSVEKINKTHLPSPDLEKQYSEPCKLTSVHSHVISNEETTLQSATEAATSIKTETTMSNAKTSEYNGVNEEEANAILKNTAESAKKHSNINSVAMKVVKKPNHGNKLKPIKAHKATTKAIVANSKPIIKPIASKVTKSSSLNNGTAVTASTSKTITNTTSTATSNILVRATRKIINQNKIINTYAPQPKIKRKSHSENDEASSSRKRLKSINSNALGTTAKSASTITLGTEYAATNLKTPPTITAAAAAAELSDGTSTPRSASSSTRLITSSELRKLQVKKLIISLRNSDNSDDDYDDGLDDRSNEPIEHLSRTITNDYYDRAGDGGAIVDTSMNDNSSKNVCSKPIINEFFVEKVNNFLKNARSKVQQSTTTVQTTTDTITDTVATTKATIVTTASKSLCASTSSKTDNNYMTPVAVRHLPASSQAEYRRLVRRMYMLEQQKQVKNNTTAITGADVAKNVAIFPQSTAAETATKGAQSSSIPPSTVRPTTSTNNTLIKQVLLKNTSSNTTKIPAIAPVSPVTACDNENITTAVMSTTTTQQVATSESGENTLKAYENAFNKTSTVIISSLEKSLKLVEKVKSSKIAKLRHEQRLKELQAEMAEVQRKYELEQSRMSKMYGEFCDAKKLRTQLNQRRNNLHTAAIKLGKTIDGDKYSLDNTAKKQIACLRSKLAKEIDFVNSIKYCDIKNWNCEISDGGEKESSTQQQQQPAERENSEKPLFSAAENMMAVANTSSVTAKIGTNDTSATDDVIPMIISNTTEGDKQPNCHDTNNVCIKAEEIVCTEESKNQEEVVEEEPIVIDDDVQAAMTELENGFISKLIDIKEQCEPEEDVPMKKTDVRNEEAKHEESCNVIQLPETTDAVHESQRIDSDVVMLEQPDVDEQPKKGLCEYISPLDHLKNNLSNLDPNGIICPYALMGKCEDQDCGYIHFDDTKEDDTTGIDDTSAMGAVTTQTDNAVK